MHPTTGYQLANDLITSHHRWAKHNQTARAALQAYRARQRHGQRPAARRNAAALLRHALILLGTRST